LNLVIGNKYEIWGTIFATPTKLNTAEFVGYKDTVKNIHHTFKDIQVPVFKFNDGKTKVVLNCYFKKEPNVK